VLQGERARESERERSEKERSERERSERERSERGKKREREKSRVRERARGGERELEKRAGESKRHRGTGTSGGGHAQEIKLETTATPSATVPKFTSLPFSLSLSHTHTLASRARNLLSIAPARTNRCACSSTEQYNGHVFESHADEPDVASLA
jgi:hypothetical protein